MHNTTATLVILDAGNLTEMVVADADEMELARLARRYKIATVCLGTSYQRALTDLVHGSSALSNTLPSGIGCLDAVLVLATATPDLDMIEPQRRTRALALSASA